MAVEPRLRVTLLYPWPMTQDIGDFAEVEALFQSIARMIVAAWGGRPEADARPFRSHAGGLRRRE